MLNYKDVTQKARLANADVIASALIVMGASFVGEDHQQDTYFRVQNGKLKYRRGTLGALITHYERIALGSLEKTHVYRYDVNPSEAKDYSNSFSEMDLQSQCQVLFEKLGIASDDLRQTGYL